MVESAPNPANRRGNLRGSCAQTPDLTAIDLTQFEDLNLVMRAVCHDWEVAQPIRDAICDQLIPAMEANEASSRSVCRKARRTIHLVRLMLCMDERNRRDEGRPPAIRLRKRVSERIPEPWPDYADAADAAPIFWNDGETMWLFWGAVKLLGGPPFQFITSTDSGATWSPAQTPSFTGPVGTFTPQPVNSIVRDRDGTIYLPVDGKGAQTALFATSDNGKTWRDTGGRTGGRHTSFVLGKDGSIIGYGGKNSDIDGFMPRSVTRDGGKTYQNSKTEFMPLGGGQRPSVIRLASGRLFFVADTLSSDVPGGRNASFIGLSDDEGQTWKRRELPIKSTCGYVTAMQTPNRVIHIVTSKTQPVALHIELNEAWAMEGGEPMQQNTTVRDGQTEQTSSAQWSGGIASDGNYRLDGTQTFVYASGAKQWESTYAAGRRVGTETFWSPDGQKKWERIFDPSGTWTWRIFDEEGKVQAGSTWKGKTLIDPAPAVARSP